MPVQIPMTRWAVVTATFMLLGMVATVAADDIADCSQSANDELRIRGCTSLIEGGAADAKSYYSRGLALYNLGDFRRAIVDYETYIERDPGNANAYYSRGLAFYKLGRIDRAIADFDKFIGLDPDNTDAYYSRGLALFNQGEIGRAIIDFDKFIEADPDNADAYYSRGLALYNQGDFERAVADYDRYIELVPERYSRKLVMAPEGRHIMAVLRRRQFSKRKGMPHVQI